MGESVGKSNNIRGVWEDVVGIKGDEEHAGDLNPTKVMISQAESGQGQRGGLGGGTG